ncbi:MAG: signal peptidase II [Defluviitaleaceae bacterium]|nr:signal peptidase II [Defluviitaleaceae bacterium]
MKIFKKWVLPIGLVVLVVAIDQFTKWLTVRNIPLGERRSVIDGVFSLHHIQNTGMSFGLFQGGRWIFVAITILLIAAMIYYYVKHVPKSRLGTGIRIAILVLIGGALGNFYDRAFLGYVIDMLFVEFIHFPFIFNMADVFVVCSVIALAIMSFFVKEEPKKTKLSRKLKNE